MPLSDQGRAATNEWGRVYRDNPSAYTIPRPVDISRMRDREFFKILARAGLRPGSRVLEAGCGSGRDSLYLASAGYSCVALDRHVQPRTHLRRAKWSYERVHGPISLDIVDGDLLHLPFQEASFDLVFNTGVLEHYPLQVDRVAVLSEMARVTKPGGLVAVAVPNLSHVLQPIWSRAIDWFTNHSNYALDEVPLSRGQLRLDLLAAGVQPLLIKEIDVWESISTYPQWRPLRLATHLARRALPSPPARVRASLGTRRLAIGTVFAP